MLEISSFGQEEESLVSELFIQIFSGIFTRSSCYMSYPLLYMMYSMFTFDSREKLASLDDENLKKNFARNCC